MADIIHEAAAPLAWNEDGTPFAVPSTAESWRVRRYNGKPGRPKAVWTEGGILHLELSADMDQLRRAVNNESGSYRLYPCDRHGNELEPIAVIELVGDSPLRRLDALAPISADTPPLDGIPGRMAAEIPHRFFDMYERMLTSRDAHDELLSKLLTTLVVSTSTIQQSTAALLTTANTTVKVANGVDALERVQAPVLDIDGMAEKLAGIERLQTSLAALGQGSKPDTPWFVHLLNGPIGMGLMSFANNFAQAAAAAQSAQTEKDED